MKNNAATDNDLADKYINPMFPYDWDVKQDFMLLKVRLEDTFARVMTKTH